MLFTVSLSRPDQQHLALSRSTSLSTSSSMYQGRYVWYHQAEGSSVLLRINGQQQPFWQGTRLPSAASCIMWSRWWRRRIWLSWKCNSVFEVKCREQYKLGTLLEEALDQAIRMLQDKHGGWCWQVCFNSGILIAIVVIPSASFATTYYNSHDIDIIMCWHAYPSKALAKSNISNHTTQATKNEHTIGLHDKD